MSDSADSPSQAPQNDLEAAQLARRKLLKMAAYVAPVVIGSFTTRDAAAQSCQPSQPCGPPPGCPPQGGCQPSCAPNQCPPVTGCQPNCGPSSCPPQS